MSVKINFDNVSQREQAHRIIRETAREISDHTNILETLFILENGKNRQDGFGYVEKNSPDLNIVKFYMSKDEFEKHLDILESVTVDDLDFEDEINKKQLNIIVDKLHDVAKIMRKNII